MGKLEGKTALITGGNSGIGLATANQFVNEGAYVFITGRRDPELAAAVKEIGRNVTGVQGDVSNLGDLDRLFEQIKQEKGKLDIVFANAGASRLAPLGKITEEHYDSVFNSNVKGLLFTVQKALPLLPGLYRLDIAIKDVNNPDHIGIFGRALDVPTYEDDKIGASSLILADEMNTVSSRQIGTGNFIISNMFIRPRVATGLTAPVSFNRSQELNFWMQFYNLGIDDSTKSNSATVTYEITDATGTVILQKQLESKDLDAHSDQLTVERSVSIAGLEPGKYKVTVTINDAISKQEIAQSAPFVVE